MREVCRRMPGQMWNTTACCCRLVSFSAYRQWPLSIISPLPFTFHCPPTGVIFFVVVIYLLLWDHCLILGLEALLCLSNSVVTFVCPPLSLLSPVAVNWLSSSSSSHSAPPPGSGSRPVEHENQDSLDIKGRLWQPSDMEASSSD